MNFELVGHIANWASYLRAQRPPNWSGGMGRWASDFGAFYNPDVNTPLKSRGFFTPRRTGLKFVAPRVPNP